MGTYAVRDADDAILTGNRYEYDANGNITKIEEVYTVNGADACRTLAEYEYDVLNQLTKETRYDYSTTPEAITVVNYTVDAAGNLRTVSGGGHIISYTYGDLTWADLLTAYDGHAIAYEGQIYDALTGTVTGTVASGNPINWYNGNSYTDLNWGQGRRLSSITKGNDTYFYEEHKGTVLLC